VVVQFGDQVGRRDVQEGAGCQRQSVVLDGLGVDGKQEDDHGAEGRQ
jgi:hypothetical protein